MTISQAKKDGADFDYLDLKASGKIIQSGFWRFFFCEFSVVDSVMAVLYPT